MSPAGRETLLSKPIRFNRQLIWHMLEATCSSRAEALSPARANEKWVEENQQGDQKPRLVGRPMLHKASQKVINRSTGTSPMQWWKVRLVPGWLSSAWLTQYSCFV